MEEEDKLVDFEKYIQLDEKKVKSKKMTELGDAIQELIMRLREHRTLVRQE